MRGGSPTSRRRSAAGADLVIDGGELPGTPSTVIDLREYESGLVDRARARSPGVMRRAAIGPVSDET